MPCPGSNPRLPLPSRNALRIAILAALSAAPVLQAATVPPGTALDASEFRVNSFTTHNQEFSSVARDAVGDFVIVWGSDRQAASNSYYDIYAQRYNAAGQPQGSEFLVNTFTNNNQNTPSVAMDAAGDFVVVWDSAGQVSLTSSTDVYAQRYNAAGQPQGSEFLVNTFTSNTQLLPVVAMDAAGDFVIVWQSLNQAASTSSYDIYARQYTSAGSAVQASEFLVNTYTTGLQQHPAVAMDAAGDFVVVWDSNNQASSNSSYDIYAQRYNSAGQAQGSEFLVDTFISNGQSFPAVAMDAVGNFVVAWESLNQAASNSNYDTYVRQYTAAGSAVQASEFLANTYTSSRQVSPKVAMDAAGDFVVAWESTGQAFSGSIYDVYARQYASNGSALQTSEFLLSVVSANRQAFPAVAMDAAGDFVASWQSYDGFAPGYDIFARRFEGPESVNLAATLGASPGSLSPGGSTTATLGVNNNTPATTSYSNSDINAALGVATGISAVFTLPAGVTAGTVGGTGWSCGSQSGTSLTCAYNGSLAAASASSALTVALTANAPSTQPVQVDVTSTQQDSDSSDNTASAALTVNDVAPTATSARFTTNAGAGINGTLAATPGYTGQVLNFSVTVGPAHGGMSLNPTTGAFTYSPVRGFVGSDSFTFTAGDGTVISSAATVSITVKDVAPMAVSGGAVTTAGTEVTKILVANPGYVGQPLSYSLVTQPAHGSVNLTASSGIFTYTPASGFSGADSFKFTVSDGTLTSNSATESITVNAASGSGGGGSSGGGGGGSFGLLSLAFLGLPLFRRRRRYES